MPSSLRPTAFTLTELIVAVGLVTLLMIGVTQIFKFAGDSVSTGQALSANLRDGRAAQDVFSRDITALAKDSPMLIIRSRVKAAFRNRADQLGDRDFDPTASTTAAINAQLINKRTIDINGNGAEGEPGVFGEVVRFFDVNSRMHRLDSLSFFARDLYRRQTANSGRFIADQSSLEAWIYYGHLTLPFNDGSFYNGGNSANGKTCPGNGNPTSNPNNFFANSWILGRVAMVLVEPSGRVEQSSGGSHGTITVPDHTGTPQPQVFISRSPNTGGAVGSTNWNNWARGLAPLSAFSRTNANPGGSPEIQDWRYDLAGTSIEGYRNILTRALQVDPARRWWDIIMGGNEAPLGSSDRFEVNPFFQRGGDLSYAAAQQVPVFVQGASQFIVEYAGDFMAQDSNGNITSHAYLPNGTTDGELDFVVVNGRRQVLWYGFPRDTSSAAGPPNGSIRRNEGDVVPLRDWLGGNPPFERVWPFAPANIPSPDGDYHAINEAALGYWDGAVLSGTAEAAAYVAAWGPNDGFRPKMIRIVLTVEDPQGRLQEPPTFEYVFNLP